ncbi:GNAT family N-acetyltransferase [soil metagenome]
MTPSATLPVTTRQATPADAAVLASLAASTFRDTFGPDNTPENMQAYMTSAFDADIQAAELRDPRVTVYLAEVSGAVAGYAMLRDGPVPASVGEANAVELARLYAATHVIGAGVGATLMRRCLDEAVARGRGAVWLGVWEHNPRAIAFYRRWKFVDVGATTFQLGRDMQSDRVMMRRVTGGSGEA